MSDNVNHPSHYCQGGIECIDALKAATINKSPFEAVCVANVIKYLWRYEDKGGLEDVMKAAWYLKRLMMELEEQEGKYKLVATEHGAALHTPWNTLIVPKEGDMFNPKDGMREQLLTSLLQNGGYCPCQPRNGHDTLCPCKNYRHDGICICGMFVKVPQTVVKNDSVENEDVRDDPETTDGEKE